MPIFDFTCRKCATTFEMLVRKKTPTCPKCGSEDLEKRMSLPVVKSETTKQRIATENAKSVKVQAAEREYTQRQYEKNHED